MPSSWTPFCPQRASYKHNNECKNLQACPFCGQANPLFTNLPQSPILITSSPPAMQTTLIPSEQFQTLSRTPSQNARQVAIRKTQKPTIEQPNIGSKVLSSQLPRGSQIGPRTIFTQVSLYHAEVKDTVMKTYKKWELIR
jgi:hypothetical protein